VTICAITDRRRRDVVAQIAEAVSAGIDLVQIREPDLEAANLASLVATAVRLTRGTATRVVVNDRLDVALACGADGVHLRGDSVPPADARTIAPAPFLIGRSVHDPDEARSVADHVDYLIAGTVFATTSKPDAERLLGVDGLRAVARAVRVPVLAIGGITLDRVASIANAGAAGIAAIGLFAGSVPMSEAAETIHRRFDRAITPS
jgi:thiamine-phosphate pyrophosphorylase